MNQRRGLQGVTGGFVGHAAGGELAQFLMDERQQFFSRARITLLRTVKNLRHGTHSGNLIRLIRAAGEYRNHLMGWLASACRAARTMV